MTKLYLPISRGELYRLYWEEELSTREIGRRINVPGGIVHDWMQEYGIPRRNRSQALVLGRGNKVTRTCLVCGKEFKVRGSFLKKQGRGKYCSRECKDRSIVKKRTFRCLNCGKEFEALPSERKYGKGQFCSTGCKYAYVKTGKDVVCPTCGKVFYVSRGVMDEGRGIFCSVECRNANGDFQRRRLEKVHRGANRRPTEPERELMELLQANNLPYKYVGDGSVILNGLNPDFINVNGKKKVIELFGDYYHSKPRYWHESELGRMMRYNSLGFDCLVIWERELKDPETVVSKIKKWNKC